MKRIHVNNIVICKTYYAVCVGSISAIQFEAIMIPKATVHNFRTDFTYDWYLSDIGIEYENESYVNNLNRVFETEEEARSWISTEEYKQDLEQHWNLCSFGKY